MISSKNHNILITYRAAIDIREKDASRRTSILSSAIMITLCVIVSRISIPNCGLNNVWWFVIYTLGALIIEYGKKMSNRKIVSNNYHDAVTLLQSMEDDSSPDAVLLLLCAIIRDKPTLNQDEIYSILKDYQDRLFLPLVEQNFNPAEYAWQTIIAYLDRPDSLHSLSHITRSFIYKLPKGGLMLKKDYIASLVNALSRWPDPIMEKDMKELRSCCWQERMDRCVADIDIYFAKLEENKMKFKDNLLHVDISNNLLVPSDADTSLLLPVQQSLETIPSTIIEQRH